MKKTHLAAALALAGIFAVFGQIAAQDAPKKLTAEQWRADVKFLGDELPKRHRNAFHRLKREDYETAVKNLYDAVPNLSEEEIVVGLMRVIAMVHDGHTSVIPRSYSAAAFIRSGHTFSATGFIFGRPSRSSRT